ncbi:MAG: hypothetical protein Q8O72_15655 [Bacteroidales bacterium]|nr:hypothetical protein [Bacteroidales bacterium]
MLKAPKKIGNSYFRTSSKHKLNGAHILSSIFAAQNQIDMKKILPFIGLMFLTINTLAQEKAKESRVKVSGFANYSLFYDTRENIAAGDGLFVLYPKPENRVNELPST